MASLSLTSPMPKTVDSSTALKAKKPKDEFQREKHGAL